MLDRIRALVNGRPFQLVILAAIAANAVVIGLETEPAVTPQMGGALLLASDILLWVFIAELLLRIVAFMPRPHLFFRDGWNVFDFAVVAVCLLPAIGPFASVTRLLRVFRVVRIVSVFPGMRLIVTTMLRSIPSMSHIVMLVAVLVYIYAVIGAHLFARTAPESWGSLGVALLSVFQLLTLEGWNELQSAVLPAHPHAWLFFSSFILVAVFVVVNLFIAVIVSNLESAKMEEAAEAVRAAGEGHNAHETAIGQLLEIRRQLEALEGVIRAAESEARRDVERARGGRRG